MLLRRMVLPARPPRAAASVTPAFAADRSPSMRGVRRRRNPASRSSSGSLAWCPICKAQAPILSGLMSDPKFKDLLYYVIDFDSQKDLVRRFDARMQSTLIAFKGDKEQGRSVGDRNRDSIAVLLNKVL